MKSLHVLFGMVVLSAAMVLATSGYSQDKGDPKKVNPTLPKGWSKLGISGDQKKKILTVVGTYQTKIAALKAELEQLQKEEYQEAYKLLTDDQKDLLKKLSDPSKGADKKPDDKKADDKKDKDKDKGAKEKQPDKDK